MIDEKTRNQASRDTRAVIQSNYSGNQDIAFGDGHINRVIGRGTTWLAAERQQMPQWFVVGFGSGVAIYFWLPVEPRLWVIGSWFVAAAIFLWLVRRLTVRLAAWIVLALIAGILVGAVRTIIVAAPVLERELDFAPFSGEVAAVEPRGNGYRLILENVEIAAALETPPEIIRLSVRARADNRLDIRPGDRVSGRAGLQPPSAPALPGAYDFQRAAWFQSLGAVGFTFGQPEIVTDEVPANTFGAISIGRTIERLRGTVYRRVTTELPGERGAIAAALMVGERGGISDQTMDALRHSGLAHLLAISGLHLGLLAGFVFFLVRTGLALSPRIALRYPIKKWAAATALAAGLFYLLMAGATVPTQRSYVMLALVLGAVMLDRTAVSMRLVAVAAAVVLILRPESLVGASFQMSFAAVVALVAGYEIIGERWRRAYGAGGIVRRGAIYVGGVATTTLIASLATAPFALQLFNQVALFGIAANLVAVPVVALWVMPWAVAAFILMPFGFEAFALIPMAFGIDLVVASAVTVSSWPGAVVLAPALPIWGFAAVVYGGLWLAIWRTRLRFIGALAILFGLASAMAADPPDIVLSAEADLWGIRLNNRQLAVSNTRGQRFQRNIWQQRLGAEEQISFAGINTETPASMTCDSLGCVYKPVGARGNLIVAFSRDERGLAEDCRQADILLATIAVPRGCIGPDVTVDFFDLRNNGAHAIWLGGEDRIARIHAVNFDRGQRPWVR